jgi:hypothetical protein
MTQFKGDYAILRECKKNCSPTLISHFQVFGERRSGTNFAHSLLKENLKIKGVYNYGWKHGAPVMPVIPNDVLFLVLVRNPFEWLRSLHSAPFEAPEMNGLSFTDFLRSEWKGFFDPKPIGQRKWGLGGFPERAGENQFDRHPLTGKRFANVLEMRKVKLAAHLSLAERSANFSLINLEDLQKKPDHIINQISKEYKLKVRRRQRLELPIVSPSGRNAKILNNEIFENDRKYILENLDFCLEQRCGYFFDA